MTTKRIEKNEPAELSLVAGVEQIAFDVYILEVVRTEPTQIKNFISGEFAEPLAENTWIISNRRQANRIRRSRTVMPTMSISRSLQLRKHFTVGPTNLRGNAPVICCGSPI